MEMLGDKNIFQICFVYINISKNHCFAQKSMQGYTLYDLDHAFSFLPHDSVFNSSLEA